MSKNPFRPSNTVDPNYFVGREKEIKAYEKSLAQSKYCNPQHMAIMGERGIGKSSLLRKMEAITDHDEHIVVRRDMDSSTKTLAELVNFILAILKVEGASSGNRGKIREFFREYAWNLSVAGLGIGIDSQKSVVLQEFFYSELKKISDNTRDEAASICIMLDEAEHLEQIDGSWSFIRTVFSRLSENGSNYLVIVAGKLGLFNKISEIFSPMRGSSIQR